MSGSTEGYTSTREEETPVTATAEEWDEEYSTGKWERLTNDPIELARTEQVGTFCQKFAPNGSILDMGCGEGALTRYLSPEQRRLYTGADISSVAIEHASRLGIGSFVCAEAEAYTPDRGFGAIVWNEVLYYLPYQDVLKRYEDYLAEGGVYVVSLFHPLQLGKDVGDAKIWEFIKSRYEELETFTLTGNVGGEDLEWRIGVYRKRAD